MAPKDKSTEATEETKAKKNDLARGTFYWADPDELMVIGLDTKDGPEHPLYDPRIHRPLEASRVNNFVFYGVMTPVEARRNSEGKLEIVDGRGRVRYARAAKQEQLKRGAETLKVPVTIVKGDDSYLFGRSRGRNRHDQDGPMTTAQNIQRSLSMGKTVAQVAIDYGVTEQTVRNYQALLDAHKDVLDAMIKEELTATAAIHLAALPQDQQKEVLDELEKEAQESGQKKTVERVKKKVAEKQGKAKKTPKERIESATKLLQRFALMTAGEKTKEEMLGTLERITKVLTGSTLDKLAATDEE